MKTTFGAITDGSSNTVIIAECAGNAQQYRQGKVFSTTAVGGAAWADRDNVMAPCGYDPAKATSTGSTRPGLVVINGTNNSEVYSFYTGGANMVFADGHVAFLRESISPATFVALITYQGGEVANDY